MVQQAFMTSQTQTDFTVFQVQIRIFCGHVKHLNMVSTTKDTLCIIKCQYGDFPVKSTNFLNCTNSTTTEQMTVKF